MNRSDLQEILFSLYLRLNGYFVTGFIVHAGSWNKTEIDALAVRFPYQREPEREIGNCQLLDTSDSFLDFVVCEVKSGARNPNFNVSFREDAGAITSVLRRFGAFKDEDISHLIPKIQEILLPEHVRKLKSYPTIEIPHIKSRLRFILVAPEQKRGANSHRRYIYGDDIISYIWKCFRPEVQRKNCSVRYNRNLWGVQYENLVKYFKDQDRHEPGGIENIYSYFGLAEPNTAHSG